MLLGEIWDGYPVEALVPLFDSSDPDTLRQIAFVLSELGSAVGPTVLGRIGPLLRSTDAAVAIDCLDVVLTNATLMDGPLIAEAVGFLDSTDESLRYSTINFVQRCPTSELRAAIPFLAGTIRGAVDWMLSTVDAAEDGDHLTVEREIAARLNDASRVFQSAAVATAVRTYRGDSRLLLLASESGVSEVRRYARFELECFEDSAKLLARQRDRESERLKQQEQKRRRSKRKS